MDNLELFAFPCPGAGICRTSIGLELKTVKELDLKQLTLGMTEAINCDSPPDVESW